MENITKIEEKWRKKWEAAGIYKFDKDSKKEKYYVLEMFSYPSGANLHMGHYYNFAVSDTYARLMRMRGYNVFHPMGFDAFGLPAENYAIKTGIHPTVSTKKNVETMEGQLRGIGATYDWEHEIVTCEPEYYKWTQWMFLKLYEKGLAYKKEAPVNWCPSCNTVLANEQVVNGTCERCDADIIRKKMNQWFFKITNYAEELLTGLDGLDWPERTKTLQRNWLGKSSGAYVDFKVDGTEESFRVFTTRCDTLFGVTYCVLAPEHELANKITTKEQKKAVEAYQMQAAKQSEIERTNTVKEKTGVFTGAYAINPVNGEKIPVWLADYVLMGYGTGAIMAVPAHDERDFDFAQKFNIPIKQVISYVSTSEETKPRADKENTERQVVIVVVKHPTEDKYLTVYNEKFDWKTFVMGGIEAGETPEEAAIREVLEETGYNDITIERTNKLSFINHFYAPHKDVNRKCFNTIFVAKLNSLNQADVSDEELSTQKANWIDASEMNDYLTFNSDRMLYQTVIDGETAYTEDGEMVNSGFLNGLNKEAAINKMAEWLEENNCGEKTINYKLRDWLVSRQRYWGAPIPIIYCEECGMLPVPETDLPVVLPMDAEFTPDGESPLKKAASFVNCTCPKCGGKAERECDTLDTFVCSSWYFLRYPDAKNASEPFAKDVINKIMPVDKYIGGIEHACMHLLYARFFTKALRDMGYLNFDEPFTSLVHQGIILAADGEKMSKSRGNTVSPDPIVEEYGADILRNYLMFGFNYIDGGPWTADGIMAINKFYQKIERLVKSNSSETKDEEIAEIEVSLHKTIKATLNDALKFQFNTALSRVMEYSNTLVKYEKTGIPKRYLDQLLLLLAPFAPHITEELWEHLGNEFSIHNELYPVYDEAKTVQSQIAIGVQVNGKLRGSIEITDEMTEEEIKTLAQNEENVKKYLEGQKIVKVIYVNKKIVSIVIKG